MSAIRWKRRASCGSVAPSHGFSASGGACPGGVPRPALLSPGRGARGGRRGRRARKNEENPRGEAVPRGGCEITRQSFPGPCSRVTRGGGYDPGPGKESDRGSSYIVQSTEPSLVGKLAVLQSVRKTRTDGRQKKGRGLGECLQDGCLIQRVYDPMSPLPTPHADS